MPSNEHILVLYEDTIKMTDDYDVVLDILQKHHDKLWNMTKNNDQWGIMDHIRLEQMDQLKVAMKLWKDTLNNV